MVQHTIPAPTKEIIRSPPHRIRFQHSTASVRGGISILDESRLKPGNKLLPLLFLTAGVNQFRAEFECQKSDESVLR